MASFAQQVERDGFATVEDVLSAKIVSELIEALLPIQESSGQISGGVRNLMALSPMVRELAVSDAVRRLVSPILGPDYFPVRAILFDKTPDTNWKIPWHQDVTIAVVERVECDGYGPWSTKAGVLHAQPPAQILEQMISVRLHLDDCPTTNGALRVLPCTHRLGKLKHAESEALVLTHKPAFCEVRAGGTSYAAFTAACIFRSIVGHSPPGHSPRLCCRGFALRHALE